VNWKDANKVGDWKQFFESGNKKVEGNYVDDKLDGWTTFYNVNGKISHEGIYRKNVKDGPWNHYDDGGKLAIQQRYDMGHLKNKKEVSAYIDKQREEKK
jgi:antitoxin component YwqK of YwqJK toxin-antitoxin module